MGIQQLAVSSAPGKALTWVRSGRVDTGLMKIASRSSASIDANFTDDDFSHDSPLQTGLTVRGAAPKKQKVSHHFPIHLDQHRPL